MVQPSHPQNDQMIYGQRLHIEEMGKIWTEQKLKTAY